MQIYAFACILERLAVFLSSFCVCYIRLANTAGNIIIDDIAMFLPG